MVVTLEPTRKKPLSRPANSDERAGTDIKSRFDIICELQSNLGIDNLLITFFDVLTETLPVDGLAYVENQRSLSIELGKQASHGCGYNLIKNGHQLGELRLSREQRFSELELVEIENLVALLLIPLTNALTYLDAVEKTNNTIRTCSENGHSQKELLGREIKLAQRHNQDMTLQLWQLRTSAGTHVDRACVNEFFSALSATCRSTDILLRPSDCEFLVLQHKSRNINRNFQKRLQKNMAESVTNHSRAHLQISNSSTTVSGTDNVETLFSRLRNQLKDLPL